MTTDLIPTDSDLARMERRLFDRIELAELERDLASAPEHMPKRRGRLARAAPTHRGLRRAGWIGGTAVALGVTASLVLSNVVVFGGWHGGADPAAADTLGAAALAAVQNSDPVVGPGQYLKVETISAFPTSARDRSTGAKIPFMLSESGQLYIPADRTADWVWVRPAETIYRTYGPESQAAAERTVAQQTKEFPHGDGTLQAPGGAFYGQPAASTLSDFSALPTEPHLLLNFIYLATVGQGAGRDSEAFVYIADRLRTGVIPAKLRAAFYQALALIPGVEITDKQVTLDGRTGVAVGIVNQPKERQEIIIDPTTGLLIGERFVASEESDGLPAGSVLGQTSITTSVVDSAPQGGTLCGDVAAIMGGPCLGK